MSIFTAKYAIYISKIDVKIIIDLKIKKLKRKMKGLSEWIDVSFGTSLLMIRRGQNE
jgi:hypothetical protein